MSIYDSLNEMQKEAVYTVDGPMLILAGAGSGKTRTLTHRIAYLIDEADVNPWNILAITFTNKAAGEMRERVDALVEFGAESIWVSTFHSTCVRILRRNIECLGYTSSFSIYDTDDQKTLLHQVMKKLDVDSKMYKDRVVMKYISSAKDNLITPEEFCRNASGDYRQMKIGDIYTEYQEALKKNNAMDFDDLIMKTVELFRNFPEVLEYYQKRFKYIMVDEYQDTNTAQFEFIRLIAQGSRNLCVVGDDDQSIYKFRGANIENILGFENHFPDAKVIRLEQNYRSTKNILEAANEVIKNNKNRKSKRLWTDNDEGVKVRLKTYETAMQEADHITSELIIAHENGISYKDCAVLYRTNAQSRVLEERMVNKGIPYQIVGGINFYQRKEIKDILAYLKTISNGNDDLATARIINVPKRGIGATTIGRVQVFADENNISFFSAVCRAEEISSIAKGKATAKLIEFSVLISAFRSMAEKLSLSELIRAVLEKTGYMDELKSDDSIEAQTRIENIEEFINKAVDYEGESENGGSLSEFLEEVSLVADIDRMDPEEERVVMMTLHSAKGLEFDKVYLCGMEDGLFPSMMSINSDNPEDIEEERRLAYVGITRAKKELTLTASRQRMVNGETRYSKVSRFCGEIPDELLDSNLRGLTKIKELPNVNKNNLFGKSSGKAINLSEISSFSGGYVKNKDKSNTIGSRTAGMQFTVQKMDKLPYKEGDKVSHKKFGLGTVISITDGKRDYEVEVDFDKAGTKRMFASFAKLVKVD